MKKIRNNRVILHPIMAFLIMTLIIIALSGVLDLFDASVNYNKINIKTGNYESVLVTVESLFRLGGLKYIFSNTVANFVSFAPLSMLLITLIGIGIMDKSGFLDTLFFVLTKKMPKMAVTYVFSLICILASTTGDISFIVFIPLAALLFKYGKRNPKVGIINAFAAIATGYSINVFLSSTDTSLIELTETAAKIITNTYSINSNCYLFIMIVAILIASGLITYVTEKIIAPRMGKYDFEEEIITDKEKLTRRELRGLIFAGFGAFIYLLIFIYNIIPYAPLGGKLLDYSQVRYIDKLFGYDSFFNSGYVFVITFFFFLCGLLYGIGTKTIKNHRDICNFLSHALDGIGKIIVLIFFASMFISLLKYTNIGMLFTAMLTNSISDSTLTGIPLLIVVFVISGLSALLLPSFVNRWQIISATIVPLMMTSGFSPEMTQLVFTTGSSIAYGITPVMAYFVIYVAYMEKYDKDGVGILKSINYIAPYTILIMVMWLLLLILWYLIGLPIGIDTFPVM